LQTPPSLYLKSQKKEEEMRKYLLVFLVVVIIAGLAVFGCKPKEPEMTTLVYATTESITNMDTSNAYDFHTWELFQNINVALLTYAPGTTDLIPGLAES
jgi:ABC-type transport system substrate-binding protein